MDYLRFSALLLFLMVASFSTQAQDELEAYERRVFVYKNDTLPYRILYPENYDASQKYPLILVLHGAGERGRDNQKQLTHGARTFLIPKNREQYPAIVVFPQCPPESYWSNVRRQEHPDGTRTFTFRRGGKPTDAMRSVMHLLDELKNTESVDEARLYLGGLSMGGMGTFELLRRQPHTFAAAFPICGGGHPAMAKKYARHVSLWVFHGAKDNIVLPEHSTRMVAAIRRAGGDVKYTLYPDANHNSWDPAFAEPLLLPWLFSHQKKN